MDQRWRQPVCTAHHIRDRSTLAQDNPAGSFNSDSLNSGILKLNNLWAAAQEEGWWDIDCTGISERESKRAQSVCDVWFLSWMEQDPDGLGIFVLIRAGHSLKSQWPLQICHWYQKQRLGQAGHHHKKLCYEMIKSSKDWEIVGVVVMSLYILRNQILPQLYCTETKLAPIIFTETVEAREAFNQGVELLVIFFVFSRIHFTSPMQM